MEEGRDARSKQAAKVWQSDEEGSEGGWAWVVWPALLCSALVPLEAQLLLPRSILR